MFMLPCLLLKKILKFQKNFVNYAQKNKCIFGYMYRFVRYVHSNKCIFMFLQCIVNNILHFQLSYYKSNKKHILKDIYIYKSLYIKSEQKQYATNIM